MRDGKAAAERSCGLAGSCRRWEGRMKGWRGGGGLLSGHTWSAASLVLSSVQAMQQEQQSGCQQTQCPPFLFFFVMDESTFSVSTCPLSRWSEARVLHSEATDASADGVQSQSTWRRECKGFCRGPRRNKRWPNYQDGSKTNETAPSAAGGGGGARTEEALLLADCQMPFSKPLEKERSRKELSEKTENKKLFHQNFTWGIF